STGRLYPIGGDALAEGSIEARVVAYRVSRDWGVEVALFLDGGDVTASLSDLSLAPSDLHWATGVGLYMPTPIGPVGVDVGFRLNRLDPPNPDPGNTYSVNFTLGEPF